jgi:cyclophilin family peptidyl-prolyl cis-trans isomerase
MKNFFTLLRLRAPFAIALLILGGLSSQAFAQGAEKPRAVIRTSMGDITVELYPTQAPKTVENFLQYARDGFYEGTTFHRVISSFMIQGGGLDADYRQLPTREPIPNEADNGMRNLRGTIAMARTNDPDSATSQFFINVEANPPLDHTGKTDSRAWGYTVFGHVVDGMDVVDKIRFVRTDARDTPLEPVMIEGVDVL